VEVSQRRTLSVVKAVRAQNFPVDRFFKFLRQSENELLVSEMQRKLGVTVFSEKLAFIIQHGLQGFIVKNIGGEANESYFVEVGLLLK